MSVPITATAVPALGRRWLLAWIAVAGCSRAPTVERCAAAQEHDDPGTADVCERAWQATRAERAAVAGAYHARIHRDDAALRRWVERAKPTVEGARILHFWGERQRALGDLDGAERTLRQALQLRVDRDPGRATNTALALLELVQSRQPAEESIGLARLAWDQAERSGNSLSRAIAASALVDIFVDLGELDAAEAVIRGMNPGDSRALKDIAEGRLRAAQGRLSLAVALFRRATRPAPDDPGRSSLLNAWIALVHALLDVDRGREARAALDEALAIAHHKGAGSVDVKCRLAAAEAAVLLAEGKIDAALASVERGLALSSRDAARIQLLNVGGDALARRGDFATAEQTWRAAADSVEAWRASIPSTQLRTGLVAHHRHALEAWLDSTAARHDVDGALEVTRRMVGRALLDRIRQREAGPAPAVAASAPAPAEAAPGSFVMPTASIDEVVGRLAADRELAATMTPAPDLLHAGHDMVAFMSGARSTWAIRRIGGLWSIDRVGDRSCIAAEIDAYRRSPDDAAIAARLGDAMFPAGSVPHDGAPLVVLLDRELADVALASLRIGGRYLVERAAIIELLAPELVLGAVPRRSWQPAVVIGDPAGDLTSAADEVAVVAHQLSVEPRRGPAATRSAVAGGDRARVMHIATHSTVRSGSAELALADGALSALEIVRRKIAPRLAVIATCRSQVDDDPAGSLVAAFLAAGAAGVVGVKRALDDSDGAALMLGFYRAGGADDPVQGLARAQRAAIVNHRPPHAWASVSFFGVGGWISTQE